MQVAHIKISNILGIESLEVSPGQFNVVSGRNGTGKTSLVEAMKSVLKGGHDATLLRNGAEKGEIVFVLDDGSSIGKKVGAEKSEQFFIDAQGRKLAKPAEGIKTLFDALSVNPIEFLLVPEKQRVAALLEAMPIRADLAKVEEVTGIAVQRDSDHYDKLHAMETIEQVRKIVYDERTGVNRAAKEKRATAKQLADNLPPAGAEKTEDEAVLKQELADLQAAQEDALGKADKKMAEIQEAHNEVVDGIREEISALEAKIAAANVGLSGSQSKVAERKAEINQRAAVKRAEINARLDAINNGREARAKAAQARETVKSMNTEADALESNAASLTAALEGLEAYKAELLASLPIPGLEVRDGAIFHEGIPFDRLNEAKKVCIAVELAKLRAGSLGLVCVDGIERLDSTTFEAFREAAMASGLQMVVSKVSDGEFAVSTESAA